MITKEFSIFTKSQKLILYLVDIIQVVLGLVLISFVFTAMLATQSDKDMNIWHLIMGIAGIISLVDIIIRKTFNKQSILHNLLIKKFKSKILLFPQTSMQAEICSWLNTKIQNRKAVLIYGKANMGKTSSVFIYLLQHAKEKELLQKLNWTESIVYIDCKNSKSNILDFFYNKRLYFCNNRFEKSLIIVDNLENMGKTFLETLLNTVNSTTGTFILLADSSKIDNDVYNSIEKKYVKYNSTLLDNIDKRRDLEQSFLKLSSDEKMVILIIFYMSLSMTLIPVNDVYTVLKSDYSSIHLKLVLNVLSYKKFIKKFPFDHRYILLLNRIEMANCQKIFWSYSHNIEAILKILQNSDKFPESAWLCLIHLPYKLIRQQDANEKDLLFSNALKCGNYLTLYKALQEELTYFPVKEKEFLYELGTLCFYNSNQESIQKI